MSYYTARRPEIHTHTQHIFIPIFTLAFTFRLCHADLIMTSFLRTICFHWFFSIFLGWIIPLKWVMGFCAFLVLMYICLNVKHQKNSMYFCAKIFYSINNYAHHGKSQPHHGVEDGFIFVKLVCLHTAHGWTYKHGIKQECFNHYKLCYLLFILDFFYSKSLILLGLSLFLANVLFSSTLPGGFKMNYPLNLSYGFFAHF